MIVDVDESPRKAAREAAGEEQRQVAEALQQLAALLWSRRLQRIGEAQRQRARCAARRLSRVHLVGACKQRQQVDDVLLGLRFDRDLLVTESSLQRIAKVLAQARHREHALPGITAIAGFLIVHATCLRVQKMSRTARAISRAARSAVHFFWQRNG